MAKDREQLAHQEWLGYVQPTGLVVSIPALLQAQVAINRQVAPQQAKLIAILPAGREGPIPEIPDFPVFTQQVLCWEPADLVGRPGSEPIPPELEVHLPAYHETLRPTYAVPEIAKGGQPRRWILLIQDYPRGIDFDALYAPDGSHWQATPQARLERLLRESGIPIGLLANPTHLRLVYAPRGESSGYITFPVKAMAEVSGRPIFAAFTELLGAERLFTLPEKQRLPALLADSRKYQAVVSTQLAEQVLAALYELVRGFQAAHDQTKGELLREVLASDPNHAYAGLLTVLMRLVFVLYAEDRGLLSSDPVFTNFYSVTGLFERLRSDYGRFPDTMDLRYGAWAQLLTLFRLIHSGGSHGNLRLPAREGYLFDPDRYRFLEGRATKTPLPVGEGGSRSEPGEGSPAPSIPRVSDGVVYRVLEKLLILDGERLSYRTLDVEQIGSVYETMMGFDLEVAQGRSIAVKPAKSHGAPATINLEGLLETKPADRGKWLAEQSDQKLTGQALTALKEATTIEELLAALDRKIARHATPNVVAKGAMVLQPSDERRRSGSHYTPRSLTEPIVRKTLEPILKRLASSPPLPPGEGRGEGLAPQQILDLKICDPAMGSGAFLVQACRQLGDELVKAWHAHDCVPRLPPDEDEVLHARRIIAQRCLYGVDKNPMAVDLAKLSLWLATLAKDHPFTFLDHALKHGDSLVGLTRSQIVAFDWDLSSAATKPKRGKSAAANPKSEIPNPQLFADPIARRLARVTEFRQKILEARDDVPYEHLRSQLDLAEEQLQLARLMGDVVIAAFFAGDSERSRRSRLEEFARQATAYLAPGGRIEDRAPLAAAAAALRRGAHPISPFHWEVEFPEVFGRENSGFDAIVGNPPFAGKNTLLNSNREGFLDWLKSIHEESHGNSDLVAHFFRRAFNLLRQQGCFGLIATNTIGQGDTRSTGLRWICVHGGTIYSARRRYRWPGEAAVVVSVVHAAKGPLIVQFDLDGTPADRITAYLFHAGGHDDPAPLAGNAGKSFIGSYVLGMGFTFDDTDKDGVANPISLMHELIAKDKRNTERIFPYIGGEEVNESPTHAHHRYVINFGEMTEDQARRWPDLMRIVEEKVKPARLNQASTVNPARWWMFARPASELTCASRGLAHLLVCPIISNKLSFALLPANTVFSHKLCVFPLQTLAAFAVLQSRVHEVWAFTFSSTMKDDLNYSPTDCFETFPFPENYETDAKLQVAGKGYYDFRAALMVKNNEGLTKTYNRFHDPAETSPEIARLRELHADMDRAVLDAYGWTDLQPECGFGLDYLDVDEDELSSEAQEQIAAGPLWWPTAEAALAFASLLGDTGRRLPWRYRWPDETRDEILARLLALNAQRAEQERLAGAAAADAGEQQSEGRGRGRKGSSGRRKKAAVDAPAAASLFNDESDSEGHQ